MSQREEVAPAQVHDGLDDDECFEAAYDHLHRRGDDPLEAEAVLYGSRNGIERLGVGSTTGSSSQLFSPYIAIADNPIILLCICVCIRLSVLRTKTFEIGKTVHALHAPRV